MAPRPPKIPSLIHPLQAPSFKREIDPNTEIVVTSGANEGIYAFEAAFLQPGDEVIMFEPFFDQVSWIQQ
jgi:kynurenine aminotransferase